MNNEELDFLNAETLRKKAEEKLKLEEHNKSISDDLMDMKKLLHELQVHQIELELQNEELHSAYEKAEKALRNYTLLFDLSPIGYFSLDSEGSINELNFTGADILGERRFSLINSNFKLFVSEKSRPIFNDFFSKVFSSKAKESCKIELSYNNRPLCSVYLEGVVIEDGQHCLLSVVDLSKFIVESE